MQVSPLRAYVYMDGFNLYHGCFDNLQTRPHWRLYRWLDLRLLSNALASEYSPHGNCRVDHIRYFTALIDPGHNTSPRRIRQEIYLRALETLPDLTIHRGRFAIYKRNWLLADPTVRTPTPLIPEQTTWVMTPEEKGSDVNLAAHLVMDGCQGRYDVAIIVTNDSDLAEPIRMVKNDLGLRTIIVNPRNKTATDLKNIADFYVQIRHWMVVQSQFPHQLQDEHGTFSKSPEWA